MLSIIYLNLYNSDNRVCVSNNDTDPNKIIFDDYLTEFKNQAKVDLDNVDSIFIPLLLYSQ